MQPDSQSFAQTIVIGGGSGIGAAVVRALAAKNIPARAISRHCRQEISQDGKTEFYPADVLHRDELIAACHGAQRIYYCANAPYHQWAELLPAMLENVIAAAARANAQLIIADNLYMYPPLAGSITEALPYAPITRKGAIRAQLSEKILAEHKKGSIRAVIGCAPDYYGPNAFNSLIVNTRTINALRNHKALPWMVSADQPHAIIYVDDFAEGLLTLAQQEKALGEIWHIPSPQAITGRQFLTILQEEYTAQTGAQLRGDSVKIQVIAPWMLLAAGIFDPIVREIYEMRYEFDRPYLVDTTKFTQAFGAFTPTPHRLAIRQTLRSVQLKK